MIEGILLITLEPPTVGFVSGAGRPEIRACSMPDLNRILEDLGVDVYGKREFIARLKGTFSENWLEQFDLLPRVSQKAS